MFNNKKTLFILLYILIIGVLFGVLLGLAIANNSGSIWHSLIEAHDQRSYISWAILCISLIGLVAQYFLAKKNK